MGSLGIRGLREIDYVSPRIVRLAFTIRCDSHVSPDPNPIDSSIVCDERIFHTDTIFLGTHNAPYFDFGWGFGRPFPSGPITASMKFLGRLGRFGGGFIVIAR